MQTWDKRQSRISAAGSLILIVIAAAVLINRTLSLFWLLPALAASAAFYAVNMRRYLQRRQLASESFPKEWRLFLAGHVRYYRDLPDTERLRFEQNVTFFLSENRITGIGTEANDEIRLLVAASAVMLIFGHDDWEYPRLPEILLYPGTFDEEYNYEPGAPKRMLAGQVVPHNAIILSVDQLEMAFKEPAEAYHVALHEFAHTLDLSDGAADGIPGDLDAALMKQWYELMKDELAKVRQHRSVLNPYAGKDTSELFAVAVEHFFQRPEELRSRHPELYKALSSFFNQHL
jgi:hypothetical protein